MKWFIFVYVARKNTTWGRQAARVHALCNKLYNFIVITSYVEPSYYYVKRLNVIIPHSRRHCLL